MNLSKQTREYIDSLKYTNLPYITFSGEEPYPNSWTESGLIKLDDETWKFYSRTKSMGRENVIWNLVNEKDEIIQLKTSELDLLLGTNGEKLQESLNERLEKLEDGIYATPSGYDILNWMKNKPKPYRIVYDNNIKNYFIGDAYECIHLDITEAAYNSGFYPDMLSVNDVDDYTRECMDNGTILFFAFYPDEKSGQDSDKSSDGYTRKYVYDFGIIYAHEMTPLENFELYTLLGEPISKKDVFEDYIKIKGNKMSENLLSKLNKIMKPTNNQYWKGLIEDMGAGMAPCPALGGPVTNSGCTVNGMPVEGLSVKSYNKKKKKSKKKNEDVTQNLFIPNEYVDEYVEKSEVVVTPEEMIEEVEETFDPATILVTKVKNNREIIKVSVKYDTAYPGWLHILKLEYLDMDEETVLDETIEEDLTIQDCKDELVYIFSTHEAIDGELYENIVSTDMENLVSELLNEDFNEAYERITDLIAKQLDKMNFEFANTDEIIYKKEGEYKYLFKFDNELGIIKIKVLKGEEVLVEKEWTLDEEDDVSPVFEEIENIYGEYGL